VQGDQIGWRSLLMLLHLLLFLMSLVMLL
jgi:hypothetical protein